MPVIVLGVINYGNAERQITSETASNLNTLANIEEEATKVVLQNNVERLESFTTRLQLKIELDKFNTSQDTKSQEFITNLISQVKSQIPSIREISVLNPEGTVVASTDKDEIRTDHANDDFFLRGIKSNDVSSFFKDKNGIPSLYLVGPLVLNGKLVGVAAITSDPSSIYSITNAFSKSSETGESYLVMRDQNGDALVLTPLRFEPDSVLNTIISKDELNRPATQSLLGNEMTMTDAIDYRGRTVLAVTRYIEGADLGLVVKIDREEAIAPLENLKYVTIIGTAAGGVAIITASLYLGKSLSLPVRRLRDKVKEISRGNFQGVDGAPIVSKWHDEVGELANHFDEMRKSIKSMNENLQQLVQEKTKELKAANSQLENSNMTLQSLNKVLEEQKEQLREVDTIKEEFSAMITHELKTPLVPIIGYSELLLDGTLGELNEKQKETVQVMSSSAISLSKLITDLLDVRKLELGKMKFEMRDCSPKELVEECLKALEPMAQAKRVSLGFKIEQEGTAKLTLKCDPKRIRQVLDNLVNNAIKFVAANTGKIEVSVKRESDGAAILFAVKDNGIGISKDKHQNIFKKFYQADTSLTRNAGGTGLGLAICKAIMGAHGGKIWFESEAGVGSAFYFSLPAGLKSTTALPTEKNMSQESLTS